jgi:hypothetical protein
MPNGPDVPPGSPTAPLALWTSNDTKLERRDDTLAFPSEEQLDLGQCLRESS